MVEVGAILVEGMLGEGRKAVRLAVGQFVLVGEGCLVVGECFSEDPAIYAVCWDRRWAYLALALLDLLPLLPLLLLLLLLPTLAVSSSN